MAGAGTPSKEVHDDRCRILVTGVVNQFGEFKMVFRIVEGLRAKKSAQKLHCHLRLFVEITPTDLRGKFFLTFFAIFLLDIYFSVGGNWPYVGFSERRLGVVLAELNQT